MPACSGHLAQSPAPSTSVDSTHQQQHKQPAKVKASASKAKQAKAPAAGSKAKSPRSSSGASASSTPAKKRCTAARHAPAVKQELLDCEDDEGDDCDLSGSAAAPGAAAERKGPISHSTVEKQRRDRINSLIDLLAEQVPPVSSKYSGSQAAGEQWQTQINILFMGHVCQLATPHDHCQLSCFIQPLPSSLPAAWLCNSPAMPTVLQRFAHVLIASTAARMHATSSVLPRRPAQT